MKNWLNMKNLQKILFAFILISQISGCVAVAVVDAAVGVTTTVVGGAVDVVDAVTPDVFSDDEDDEENKENEENED